MFIKHKQQVVIEYDTMMNSVHSTRKVYIGYVLCVYYTHCVVVTTTSNLMVADSCQLHSCPYSDHANELKSIKLISIN